MLKSIIALCSTHCIPVTIYNILGNVVLTNFRSDCSEQEDLPLDMFRLINNKSLEIRFLAYQNHCYHIDSDGKDLVKQLRT